MENPNAHQLSAARVQPSTAALTPSEFSSTTNPSQNDVMLLQLVENPKPYTHKTLPGGSNPSKLYLSFLALTGVFIFLSVKLRSYANK